MAALFRTDVKYPQITALTTRFQMFASCTLYNSRSHDAQSCILLAAIPFLWEEKLNASCPAGSEPTRQPLLSSQWKQQWNNWYNFQRELCSLWSWLEPFLKIKNEVIMCIHWKTNRNFFLWLLMHMQINKQAPDFQRVCWVSHYSLIWSDSYSGSSECISDQFEIRLGGGREKEANQIIM